MLFIQARLLINAAAARLAAAALDHMSVYDLQAPASDLNICITSIVGCRQLST
jgi:hypothetical protein